MHLNLIDLFVVFGGLRHLLNLLMFLAQFHLIPNSILSAIVLLCFQFVDLKRSFWSRLCFANSQNSAKSFAQPHGSELGLVGGLYGAFLCLNFVSEFIT